MTIRRLAITLVFLLPPAAVAQHHHGTPSVPTTSHSSHAMPYAGFQNRDITALSPRAIADLLAENLGRFMGMSDLLLNFSS